VVVAVKVPHHRELILPALEAGKMILCEWPLGNGLAEAEELAAVAEAQGSAPLWVYRPAQLPRSDTSGT
jgi:predicted dehydrogenase